eukprot:scaffold225526_cov34-Prasinocladus_malaysianus.AAC.1
MTSVIRTCLSCVNVASLNRAETEAKAEDLDLEALATAEMDTLAECAPDLVSYMNKERAMDVLRITGD